MEIPTVLYIAGYGRSGSTVLDVVLGSSDRVVSAGELVYLGQEWQHQNRTCACGTDYRHCPFWKGMFSTPEEVEEWKRVARRVEYRNSLFHLLTDSIPDRDRQAYRREIRAHFSHIAERGSASVVVESSKSARHAAGRFWALRNIAGLDVKVLHLVRDGREVLRSVVEKGTNWAAEGYREEKRMLGVRTTIGWMLANSLALVLGNALDGNRYLRIRFEDLLNDPEPVLRKIGGFAEIDVSGIVRRIDSAEPFSIGHNVGGNRLRHQNAVRLRQQDKDERASWEGLSLNHRVLFGLLGQGLNTALGYEW